MQIGEWKRSRLLKLDEVNSLADRLISNQETDVLDDVLEPELEDERLSDYGKMKKLEDALD